jgi:hypothetical protein
MKGQSIGQDMPEVHYARRQLESGFQDRLLTVVDPVLAQNKVIGQRGDNRKIHVEREIIRHETRKSQEPRSD